MTLRPDIAVFSISGHGPGLNNPIVQQLQAAKVPVVFVDFRNAPLEHTVPSLRIMGKALQREAEAERFIRFYQGKMDAIRKVVAAIPAQQKPKAFLTCAPAPSAMSPAPAAAWASWWTPPAASISPTS